MDPVTSVMLLKALDGLSARAAVTAENIANAGSPGFRPLRLSFEDALAAAAPQGAEAVRAVRPTVAPDASAGEVRIDLEIAEASATSARYTALIDLLGRQLQLETLAVTGGR